MDLSSTDFELFDVPARFAQERATLDARWKTLQTAAHPDRFVGDGSAAQRVAMQWAVRINEAYQRLKDPLRRAAYLCALNGAPVDTRNNKALPADFLMQQMQWREALERAPDGAAVDALADEVSERERMMLRELATLIDERVDWPAAARQVQALMFVMRFNEDIDRRREALEQ
jgi:molecular chaperone HscB